MALAPDILDALGLTPRELGAVHVHFEGVKRVDGRRVVAVLLVQAAFRPLPRGGEVAFRVGAHTVARGPLPLPQGTEVLRVTWPMVLPADVPSVLLQLELPPPAPGSERIRQAWRLYDTLEIPKLSEMDEVPRVADPALPAGILLSVLMGDGLPLGLAGAAAESAPRTTVHRAPELPPVERQVEGTSRPFEAVHVETVWMEGQPIPQPPPVTHAPQAAQPRPPGRSCRACAWEGAAEEVERLTLCPACGALWV